MTQTTPAGDQTPLTQPAPNQPVPNESALNQSALNQPDQLPPPAVRVRAGSPAALLAIVPHLLGFVPESSMVIIGTEAQHGAVKVTLRYDLPEPPEHTVAEDMAEHAAAVLGSQHLTGALAVGYGPDELVRPVAMALWGVMVRAGIDLAECLRVDQDRYWSYTCSDEDCCPDDGMPFEVTDHAAAILAGSGEPVLPNRGAMAGVIGPVTGAAAQAMRLATRRAERHVTQVIAKVRKSTRVGAARHMIASEGLAAVASLIATYRGGGQYASDYQIAWLTVALKDLRVRDDAWARMDPVDRAAHLRLWTDVVRRAQPGYVAAPASLLAFVAWQDGNGVLANLALDRALKDTPGYSMATLLRQVITAGAPPSMARLPMTPEEVAACYAGTDDGTRAGTDAGTRARTDDGTSDTEPDQDDDPDDVFCEDDEDGEEDENQDHRCGASTQLR
jgi:hypothetical protein